LIWKQAFDIFSEPRHTDKYYMSTLNPAGRLSKVDKGGKIFQIQTEFYHRPRRKITSTVILNGEIQNKVDTLWEEQLITDEDLRKIEKAL